MYTQRVEERIHVDLNRDGQIGRSTPGSRLEQATHVDINRDGFIGHPPPSTHPAKNSSYDVLFIT
jgi:hypothetical protein